MGISAIYGIGIYNQSRYGWVYLRNSSISMGFNSPKSKLQGLGPVRGTSSVKFTNLGTPGGGIVGDTSIQLNLQGHILGGSRGETSILFSSTAKISATSSKIRGDTHFVISSTKSNLEGNGVLSGSERIDFQTQADIFGFGEMSGQDGIVFSTKRALTNAHRMKSFFLFSFMTDGSEIFFENINPFYSTWNGGYIDLNGNNNFSDGYLNLLYTETSGTTNLPYKDTIDDEHIP